MKMVSQYFKKNIFHSYPSFPVHSSQIEVLGKPEDFYNVLLDRSRNAQHRIHMASLYLGISDLEQQLVSTIHENMRTNSMLKVKWFLDYTRASRGSTNSRTLLLPLLEQNSEACEVALYHTPKLRGIWRYLPQNLSEVIGLQHLKVYVFDNSVLISGANLSTDYFTNRQDRYIVINDCEPLANFYSGLLEKLSYYSFKLKDDDTVTIKDEVHPIERECGHVCSLMKKDLMSFWRNFAGSNNKRKEAAESKSQKPNTLIIPTLQIPQAGIRYDSKITNEIFQNCSDKCQIHLASGYFNLTDRYIDTVINKSKARYEILSAHPTANGFLSASGIVGAVPTAYTHLLKRFHDMVGQSQRRHLINVSEYKRCGWTFHAKGLWCTLLGEHGPGLIMIGSPNFGYRSVEKDMESQLIILSDDKKFKNDFRQEKDELFKRSEKVTKSSLEGSDRYVPIWVGVVMYFMRGLF